MTNASFFAEAVNSINKSVAIFVQVWCITLFLLGAIGHALNIYVFTRRRFRSNPCARYLLASTLAGYGILYGTLPLRLLQTAYNIDVFVYSVLTCQILTYLLNCFRQAVFCCKITKIQSNFFAFRVLSSWFIALASLDRYVLFCLCSRFL